MLLFHFGRLREHLPSLFGKKIEKHCRVMKTILTIVNICDNYSVKETAAYVKHFVSTSHTAQKMKFSIKDIFSKCMEL